MKRTKKINELGFAHGAGPGAPDARTGHGYGKASGGALNNMRSWPEGYPYMNDLGTMMDDDECDEDDEWDDEDDIVDIETSTLGDLGGHDAFGSHAKDRRSFASSNNIGILNVPVFAESFIRLRPRSSEPDSGMEDGWSRAPRWHKSQRKASSKRYRYKDVTSHSPEEDFEDLVNKHEINQVNEIRTLRRYIRNVLTGIV